jgi:1,4-alpha-glucan branching enzyme
VAAVFGLVPAIICLAQSTRPGMGAIPYADSLGTGVTFRVRAPNATSVAVPGVFNSWNTTSNFLIKETGTDLWSRDIGAAKPNDQYKFHINCPCRESPSSVVSPT